MRRGVERGPCDRVLAGHQQTRAAHDRRSGAAEKKPKEKKPADLNGPPMNFNTSRTSNFNCQHTKPRKKKENNPKNARND